jgi:hypothetical protein
MSVKIGDRAGAFLSCSIKELKFLGCGVYEGNFPPVEAVGYFAEGLAKHGIDNPRIRLDSGKIVYGCECYWGSEKSMIEKVNKAKKEGIEIVNIDIDNIREQYRKEFKK